MSKALNKNNKCKERAQYTSKTILHVILCSLYTEYVNTLITVKCYHVERSECFFVEIVQQCRV